MPYGSSLLYLVISFILGLLGWLIKYKRVTWLIPGYNTASRQEKATYDIARLCKYVGNFVFILAGLFLVIALAALLFPSGNAVTIVGFSVVAVTSVAGIIYLNTGGRVKRRL